MHAPIPEADLLDKIVAVVKAAGGTVTAQDAHAVNGTRTALTSKWFLGGRKVTDTVTCRLVSDAHEVHFRETTVETSWGLTLPKFRVETTIQTGARVTSTRTDKSVGGGGRLEFGTFRDAVDQTTRDAGWRFVHDVS